MLRSARLVIMVLIAMFIVAVPTAVAQNPAVDQYALPDDSGAAPANDAAAVDSGAAPVQVRELTKAQSDSLPFTGAQVSLIALIGLALVALGAAALASSRRRASPNTT